MCITTLPDEQGSALQVPVMKILKARLSVVHGSK